MDLLISYSWKYFSLARREVIGILQRLGDPEPTVEKSSVWGVAIAHTCLDNRAVIRQCRQIFQTEAAFRFAIKWVPVDYWCDSDLDAIKDVIERHIRERIGQNQTWGMKVEKRRWQRYHTSEIVEYLATAIDRKVNLNNPDWVVRVDVLGTRTAVSLLRPEEIFSLGLTHF